MCRWGVSLFHCGKTAVMKELTLAEMEQVNAGSVIGIAVCVVVI